MKESLHLIVTLYNQSSIHHRSKSHNFVVLCDSYNQATDRIQEYVASEYILFDKESVYKNWYEDQLWFEFNINNEFNEKVKIDGELFKNYYTQNYFNLPKGYKTETGTIIDVSYDDEELIIGYNYDTKSCYYEKVELDKKLYDFLDKNYKPYEIENLFSNYINRGTSTGLDVDSIVEFLNTEISDSESDETVETETPFNIIDHLEKHRNSDWYKETQAAINKLPFDRLLDIFDDLTIEDLTAYVPFDENSENIEHLPHHNQD